MSESPSLLEVLVAFQDTAADVVERLADEARKLSPDYGKFNGDAKRVIMLDLLTDDFEVLTDSVEGVLNNWPQVED